MNKSFDPEIAKRKALNAQIFAGTTSIIRHGWYTAPSGRRVDLSMGNRIEVKYVRDLYGASKRGRPLAPENAKRLSRVRMAGVPALVEEDLRRLKDLEDESSYRRRERMLKANAPAGPTMTDESEIR